MKFWTEMIEATVSALEALRANLLRSALATLGIIIGVLTITLMGSALEGVTRAFRDSISFLGTDVFYVKRFAWFNQDPWWTVRNRPRITQEQVERVARDLPLARAVAPVAGRIGPVEAGSRKATGVYIIGTTEQYLQTAGFSMQEGRFITGAEAAGGRPVCVLGMEVADRLFQGFSPIGQRIRVAGVPVLVVGVVGRQGEFLGLFSLDNQVLVPLEVFRSRLTWAPDVEFQVKVRDLEKMDEAKEQLRGVMRRVRRLEPGAPDDFAINQQTAFLETFYRVGGMIGAIGLAITSLALFVGGVGIMNIMLVSVTERTREIGIRMALGARRRSILVQFLMEAALICLIGGLAALVLALPVVAVMRTRFPATLSLPVVSLALGTAAFTGVVSGLFPAWRASRLPVVDALRRE